MTYNAGVVAACVKRQCNEQDTPLDDPEPTPEHAKHTTSSRHRMRLERVRLRLRILRRSVKQLICRTPARLDVAYEWIQRWVLRTVQLFHKLYSRTWFLLDRTRQRLSRRSRWTKLAIVGIVPLLLILASVWAAPVIDSALASHITTDGISALLLALGAAEIGAMALAFTLVMFAMQVNVERLPHGLFRRFSTDTQLLAYFAAMFAIALGVTLSSLIASMISDGIAVLLALWACLLITGLLWTAYRRALLLISPWVQLQLMVSSTARRLQRSVRRARMLEPLMQPEEDEEDSEHDPQSPFGHKADFDAARSTIFHLDPNWAAEAYRSVSFAMSFAARFAEHGDYETSGAALRAIVQVNANYIDAKGKTFIGSHPFASLTSPHGGGDPFISETLEHLRQYMHVALGRKDERQIEQIFGAFADLTRVYLDIEYAVAGDSNHYAELSAGYLTAAVKTVPSLKSPDVLMDGIRKIGIVGRILLASNMKIHVATMSEALYELAVTSMIDPKLRVVVDTIMKEYKETLIQLLLSKEYDIHVEAKKLQERVASVVMLLLQVPETSSLGEHSSCAKFYSTGHMSSLCAELTQLTNALVNAQADDSRAERVVRHVQAWADKLWESHRKLLLRAVEKKSQLTFDLIHWISRVSQMLIFIAVAPVSNSHLAADLRRSASWLALTLSFIPQDKDSIDLAECFNLTEQLFEIARTAQQRQAPDIAESIYEVMLDRACSAAAEEAGWRSLSKTIQGLCVLAVMNDESDAITKLEKRLEKKLSGGNAPSQEYRERTAKWIFESDHYHSPIGYAIGQVDRQRLQEALRTCATVLHRPGATSSTTDGGN